MLAKWSCTPVQSGKKPAGQLEDATFAGRIPACNGVVAFETTPRECQEELRSTLEDWILVGIKLGHRLPLIGGVDLNKAPTL